MKKLLFILLILFIMSCSSDYRLSSIKHRELSYEELPDSVRTLLYQVAGDTIDRESLYSNHGLLFVNPSDSSVYRFKVVSYKLAPWIPAYRQLIDTENDIIYRIDNEDDGPPYIVDSNTKNIFVPCGYYSIVDKGIFNTKYKEYNMMK